MASIANLYLSPISPSLEKFAIVEEGRKLKRGNISIGSNSP